MKIKILLADDHRLGREGLRTMIETQTDMEVVADVGDGRSAVKAAMKHNPDVVIMDITMPELNGIEATRQILFEVPAIKIIALSMYSERRFVAGMLKAGAKGYLLKDCAFKELMEAISTVLKNRIYMSSEIANVVVKDYIQQLTENDDSALAVLTLREREVLQLIAEGNTTRQIASELNVSIKTIDTHRRQIMNKLKVKSVAELTKLAVREGLTSLQ